MEEEWMKTMKTDDSSIPEEILLPDQVLQSVLFLQEWPLDCIFSTFSASLPPLVETPVSTHSLGCNYTPTMLVFGF